MGTDFSFSSRSISRSLLVEKIDFGWRQRAVVDPHVVDLASEDADVDAEVRTDPKCIVDRDHRLRQVDRLGVGYTVDVQMKSIPLIDTGHVMPLVIVKLGVADDIVLVELEVGIAVGVEIQGITVISAIAQIDDRAPTGGFVMANPGGNGDLDGACEQRGSS